MKIDVSLATWILSVVTFLLGTIIPVAYQRLFYEGISLKQPFKVRVLFQEGEKEQAEGIIVFSTIIKIASVRKDALLLDDIKTKPIKPKEKETFTQISRELRYVEADEVFFLPPSVSPKPLDYLPLVIRSNEEKFLIIGLYFQSTIKDTETSIEILSEFIENHGLKVSFRINGHYRAYRLHIEPKLQESYKRTYGEKRSFFMMNQEYSHDYIKVEDGIVKEIKRQRSE